MSRTIRNIPKGKRSRTPRYRWKLMAGISRKRIVTDYDDRTIAGGNESYGWR